ncbi:Pentatricopeptide repeat-containing protein [Thalictrum thalictroides]|uniref:Pentatricopeptide repeat-containing protein n=1 Tax=Thalictrum thalictroides TaxID=46969 RepID=A0A7J6WW00_THATH|nr:Pentatricopeptide repeat-containing protein [Thalictrum thalictroides]
MKGRIFNCLTSSNATSSTLSLVTTNVQTLVSKGLFQQTLEFYKEHVHVHPLGFQLNKFILPSVIKACSSAGYLHFGLQLHCLALKTGFISDVVMVNSLLSMYAKCSSPDSASQLFESMPTRDTITWNSMITCYVQNGYVMEAIAKFKEMYLHGFRPKSELIASILSVCGRNGRLRLGKEIHSCVVINGEINQCLYLSTSLVDMYSRCFDLKAAYHIFRCMKEKNEVSWTAMIAGCITNDCYIMSLDLFRAMQVEEFKPNRVTLLAVLPACAELGSSKHGRQIHGYAIRHRYELEPQLATAVMDMYCKCEGTLSLANLVFKKLDERDVVMWSSLIGSYSKTGNYSYAMRLFNQMRIEGIHPNATTMLAILTTYSANHGRTVHAYIVKSGFDSDLYVGNSLIDMYAKCGRINASHQIFNEIPVRDSVSWSALIQGYGLNGCGTEALKLFHAMQEKDIKPDGITYLAILSACNHGGLVEEGHKHFKQMQQDKENNLTVQHYACYIDLLGRSGYIEDACKVIKSMPIKPSPTIWSSLISSCKIHGRLDIAKQWVHQLIDSEPDNPANYTLSRMVYTEISDWDNIEEIQSIMKTWGLKKRFGYSEVNPGL